MPASNEVTIAGHRYTIAGQSLLPRGQRAYVQRLRALQQSEPGIPKTAVWKISGSMGQSRERADGFLGHDHANLDTRFDDLLTSLGAVSTLTLSTSDPLSSGSAALGALPLGGRALGGGTSLATSQQITHIVETARQVFVARGGLVTQVDLSAWVVVATTAIGATVRGIAEWFGKLRIGIGGQKAMQTVTGITTTAAPTYSDTQVSGSDVLTKELAVAGNRLYMVRADPAGTNENRIRYTLDNFASISPGFLVGDPGVNATGIAPLGGDVMLGSETGVFGFTPEGFPYNLIDALRDAKSANNGRKSARQFGWRYVITDLTLYAVRGQIANPIGIGSDSMSGFEGWDGKPVAVLAWREALFVVYENSAGTAWRGLHGHFNPSLTPGTGELDWHPFFHRTNAAVREIAATSTPTLPTIMWGEGANTLARIAKGRAGRDLSDASYSYATDGGQWFGSTMMRQQHLRKTVRWGRFLTENCTAANTWTLAVSFDGGAYSNIGSAVTSNGGQKVVPSTPTTAPTGFTPKPRLTQVAASSTAPPQIRGLLEIGYDERPDQVTECALVLTVSDADLVRLRALADAGSSVGHQPVEIRLPEDSTARYGYVTAVEEQDLTGAQVLGAAVTVLLYDAA